jgi:hypothetical protein
VIIGRAGVHLRIQRGSGRCPLAHLRFHSIRIKRPPETLAPRVRALSRLTQSLPCLSPQSLPFSPPQSSPPNPSLHQPNTCLPPVNSMLGNGGYERAATGGWPGRRREATAVHGGGGDRRAAMAATGGRPWQRLQGQAPGRPHSPPPGNSSARPTLGIFLR